MRISREQMLIEIAHTVSKRGTCGRLAVGAVIARDSRPVSIGYSGAPAGEPHCVQFGCDLSKPCDRSIHAEKNALDFAHRHDIDISGADMFVTDSPCMNCAIEIIQAGIARVFFERPYRDANPIERLLNEGIEVHQILANGMVRGLR